MDEAYDTNLRRARRLTLLAITPPTALMLLVVVGLVVFVSPLLGLFLAVVALVNVGLWVQALRTAPAGVSLAATGARPATEDDEPRLHNVVEGLCVGIGLPKPGLWIVDDDAVNALSVARSVDASAVVVTTGLLRHLTRVEQEAVLAHELARIRRGEAVVGCVATLCLGGTAALAPPPGGLAKGPAVDGPDPAVTTPWGLWPILASAPFVRAVASRGEPDDEGWTDLAAVEITRYPPGLVSALEKAAPPAGAEPTPVPTAASPAIAHLWLVGPDVAAALGAALRPVYEVRRPLADRIEMLQEL